MKKIILITGVSSGFGQVTARLFAEKGYTVYGTVRKSKEPDSKVIFIQMDLTDISTIKKTVKTVMEREGRIDVLINNAGMHTGGPVETTSPENIKLQIDTNFIGTVHLTREVLPYMRQQGGGKIINISSIGGLMGLPFQAFYSASKYAIEGFSEALRIEVKKFNINVILINPGDFHTNNTINRRNYLAPSEEGDPYQEQFKRTLKVIENDEFNGRNPEILARKIIKIAERKNPKQRYIVGSFDQKLAVLLKKILHGKLFTAILESHYKIDTRIKT